jgi:hypothetical protein
MFSLEALTHQFYQSKIATIKSLTLPGVQDEGKYRENMFMPTCGEKALKEWRADIVVLGS